MTRYQLTPVTLVGSLTLCVLNSFIPVYAQTPPSQPGTGQSVTQGGFPNSLTSADSRMTVGLASSVAGGTDQVFRPMIDFSLIAPLSTTPLTRNTKPPLGVWVNVRLSGQPQKSTPSIKQFVGGFENSIVSGSITDIVRTADVLLGFEVRIRNGFTFDRNYQLQPLLFGSWGFTTTPPKGGPPPIFELTPEGRVAFLGHLDPTEQAKFMHIGFVEPERPSFEQQWYVGLRLRTHHFQDCERVKASCSRDEPVNFPGTIDLSFGRNAAVSGGSLKPSIFRLDAFYPLPSQTLANAIYIFGSAFVHLDRLAEAEPVFLKPASGVVEVPSPQLFLHSLTPEERRRDSWQFGIAVDLVRLFKGAAKTANVDTSAAALPGTDVVQNDHATVRRLLWKKGDKLSLTTAEDILVPIDSGVLESSTGDTNAALSLTAGSAHPLSAGTRTLASTGDGQLEVLLVRPRTNPTGSKVSKAPDLTNAQLNPAQHYVSPQFLIEQITLAPNGTAKGSVTGRTTILIAMTDKIVELKTSTAEKPQPLLRGRPVLLPKDATYELTAAKDATVLVIELR